MNRLQEEYNKRISKELMKEQTMVMSWKFLL